MKTTAELRALLAADAEMGGHALRRVCLDLIERMEWLETILGPMQPEERAQAIHPQEELGRSLTMRKGRR
jgi:hypothetical protein